MKINYPLLIDGGLSNVLEDEGCDLRHKLWSAKLLITDPEAIIKAHLTYLKAGAQCITTASYQASIPGVTAIGHTKEEAELLILKSVQLAEEAKKRALEKHYIDAEPLIAASIGPYGAYLADGSEYRGNYDITDDQLEEFHGRRIKLLDQSTADMLGCETIPSFQEAKVLSKLLMDTRKPSWVSFSCKNEFCINDGTPIEECVDYFSTHPNVFAIGINCTAPKYISTLIKSIRKRAGTKKIIAYPNSGEVYNSTSKTWLQLSEPDSFEQMAKDWLNLGVDILGGCCRIGPGHIESISNSLFRN